MIANFEVDAVENVWRNTWRFKVLKSVWVDDVSDKSRVPAYQPRLSILARRFETMLQSVQI
jgi:hypothetical protein